LQPREKVVRALLIYTGLRVSPLCSIKLGDISYAPPVIRVLVKGAKIQVVKMHGGLAELVKAYAVAHIDLKGQTFLLAHYPGHHPHRRDIERMTARWGERAGVAAAPRIDSGTPSPPGCCAPPRTSGSCRRRLPTRTSATPRSTRW